MFSSTGRRFRVLSVQGIPLYVSTSWLIIVGLSIYGSYLRFETTTSPGEAIWLASLFVGLFFGGVLVHEAAHAVVARGFDLPVTGISLVFWGGATETRGGAKGPWVDLLVSFAGPASTLAMAGILFVVGEQMGSGEAAAIVRDLAALGLLFGLFNLVPAYPLDGGQMLLAVVWGLSGRRRLAMQVAGWSGVLVGVAVIVFGVQRITGDDPYLGIWLVVIGASVAGEGRRMPQRLELIEQLGEATVADVMRPPPEPVPATMSLSEALDRVLGASPRGTYAVGDADRVVGTISFDDARRIGRRDPLRPVRDAMRPLSASTYVAPDEPLHEALRWIASGDAPVLESGVLVGQISGGDVERWYQARHGDLVVPPRPDR